MFDCQEENDKPLGMWAFIPGRSDEIGLVLPSLTFGVWWRCRPCRGGLSLCTPGSARGPLVRGPPPGSATPKTRGQRMVTPFPVGYPVPFSLYTARGMVVDLFMSIICVISSFNNPFEVFVLKAVHWHIKH